jgi:hypothetical protein
LKNLLQKNIEYINTLVLVFPQTYIECYFALFHTDLKKFQIEEKLILLTITC